MKIWPILQAIFAPVEQFAMETALPIAEKAADAYIVAQTGGLGTPLVLIANTLLASLERFEAANINPQTATLAVTHAVMAHPAVAQAGAVHAQVQSEQVKPKSAQAGFARVVGIGLLAAAAFGALALGGCATQTENERAYTVATTVSDVSVRSGKLTPDIIGNVCLGDSGFYTLLTSGRSLTDGVPSGGYAPADLAHFTLQSDGHGYAPVQCVPPPPTQ